MCIRKPNLCLTSLIDEMATKAKQNMISNLTTPSIIAPCCPLRGSGQVCPVGLKFKIKTRNRTRGNELKLCQRRFG